MKGEFCLYALPAGTLPVPAWAATFGANSTALQDLGFYVWIVTDGITVGLVDTGLPLDPAEAAAVSDENRIFDQDSYFHHIRLLPELLADAGLSGADIDFVAVTQTVTYHTGGIDAELLPRAHFYLPYAGVREMLVDAPGHPATEFYFTERSWTALRQLSIEGRLHLVEEPMEIVPGVHIETTGGHHPGSAALKIHTAAGRIGLLETAFLQTNLDREQPIGIAEDIATCRAAIRRYRRECDEVIAIHEPSNASRFPLSGFYAGSTVRTDA